MEIWKFIGTFFAGFLGTSVLLGAMARFLERIWADRLMKQNTFEIDKKMQAIKDQNAKEILTLKSHNESILEGVKSSYIIELENLKNQYLDLRTDKQNFHEVSNLIYKKYFEDRVAVYLKLMQKRNQYIIEMHEDLGSELFEKHAEITFQIYKDIRNLITNNLFHISNDLEAVFDELRIKAALFIRSEDQVGIQSFNNEDFDNGQYDRIYFKFLNEHGAEMEKVLDQIKLDITKMRKQVAL